MKTSSPPAMGLLTAAALLITGGCAERARFQPTQNVNAVSPSGRPAASYELQADGSGDPKITVNVWSEGAKRDDDRTFVDISLEVRNTGEAPVVLARDTLSLEAFNRKGSPLPLARLVRVTAEKGSYVVQPRSASTVKLRFELPVAAAPTELGALRFRWGVSRDDGDRYVQFTEFRRQPENLAAATEVYYDPIFGFYDPFFYGAPYGHHHNYYVPVRRVVIEQRAGRMRSLH